MSLETGTAREDVLEIQGKAGPTRAAALEVDPIAVHQMGSSPSARRGLPKPSSWLPPLMVFAGVMGLWYFVTYVVLDPDSRFLLPAPHQVVDVAFLNQDNLSELLAALGRTTVVALVGLAISIVLGMTQAILMSQSKAVESALFPYAVILQCIPVLALVPLIGFWFGFDFPARVIVCVIIALFPIINNTLFGLKSAEAGQHDLFTLHHASRLTRLLKLQLPAALPAIFSGFRISAGLSVIGAVVGDFFFKQGDPGIGILIDVYRARIQSEQLFGAIILASLLGVAVFWLFGVLSNRVVGKWHVTAQDKH